MMISSYDMMMSKLLGITWSKTEKVDCYAARLESTVAYIRKDNAPKMDKGSEDHLHNHF